MVANNHNLTLFFAEASCRHKMKFLRNSVRNAPYSAPNFTEWFIANNLDIRNVKYCGSYLKFFFFVKTKKMIFFKVTIIIGENRSTKCLQCIKCDNS